MRILWMALAILFLLLSKTLAAANVLTVFAAASMKDAVEHVVRAYEGQSGQRVRVVFAASSTLARQIEAGAPADVFISAHQDWMDYLDQRALIDSNTKQSIASNGLVLIGGHDSPAIALAEFEGVAQLALADPEHVPAGRYAKETLMYSGDYKRLQPSLVLAENVRLALSYVAVGAVPYGIVYASDAFVEPRVKVLAKFDAASHSPIVYSVASVSGRTVDSVPFLQFLAGEDGQIALEKAGFLPAP